MRSGSEADDEAEIAVVGPSDYTLTAMVAVALLRLAADRGLPGERVVRPYEWTTLDALVNMIDAPDVLQVHRRG